MPRGCAGHSFSQTPSSASAEEQGGAGAGGGDDASAHTELCGRPLRASARSGNRSSWSSRSSTSVACQQGSALCRPTVSLSRRVALRHGCRCPRRRRPQQLLLRWASAGTVAAIVVITPACPCGISSGAAAWRCQCAMRDRGALPVQGTRQPISSPAKFANYLRSAVCVTKKHFDDFR